jgi:ubiquinone/menaquinone biosynthesis C-methylase UbiE
MLNQAEADYWDHVALEVVDLNKLKVKSDNFYKRRVILKKLLDFDFIHKSILEIGIGFATIAECLQAAYHRTINYQATDVSKVFCDFCFQKYGIPVKQAEVTELPYPDASFDWVFAFDSLEHVRPEQRLAGYAEINRVMKNDACVVLNIPLDVSYHDKSFDHGYTYLDFVELLKVTNSRLAQFNVYGIQYVNMVRQFAWAVGERHL